MNARFLMWDKFLVWFLLLAEVRAALHHPAPLRCRHGLLQQHGRALPAQERPSRGAGLPRPRVGHQWRTAHQSGNARLREPHGVRVSSQVRPHPMTLPRETWPAGIRRTVHPRLRQSIGVCGKPVMIWSKRHLDNWPHTEHFHIGGRIGSRHFQWKPKHVAKHSPVVVRCPWCCILEKLMCKENVRDTTSFFNDI